MVEQERLLIRQGSQIVVPTTYFKLRDALNPEYQLICDGLLNTGARVVEFWAICKHPEWFHASSRVIDLPASKEVDGVLIRGAAMKQKMLQTERSIRLSIKGVEVMDAIYAAGIGKNAPGKRSNGAEKSKSSLKQAIARGAIRAGINPYLLNPKSFRKDHASWLLEIKKDLGIDGYDIAQSLGHDIRTMNKHYAGCCFTKEQHKDMLDYFRGYAQ